MGGARPPAAEQLVRAAACNHPPVALTKGHPAPLRRGGVEAMEEDRPKRQRSTSRQSSAGRAASRSRSRPSRAQTEQDAQAEEEASPAPRASGRPPRPPQRRPGSAAGAAAAAAAAEAAEEAGEAEARPPSAIAAAMAPDELEVEVERLGPAASMLRQQQVGRMLSSPWSRGGMACRVGSSASRGRALHGMAACQPAGHPT